MGQGYGSELLVHAKSRMRRTRDDCQATDISPSMACARAFPIHPVQEHTEGGVCTLTPPRCPLVSTAPAVTITLQSRYL
jgi:hypothetical protein